MWGQKYQTNFREGGRGIKNDQQGDIQTIGADDTRGGQDTMFFSKIYPPTYLMTSPQVIKIILIY